MYSTQRAVGQRTVNVKGKQDFLLLCILRPVASVGG